MTIALEKPASDAPLVEVRNVRHVYGKGGAQGLVVLDDVDLTLRPNEIVALLGRSGSGKSTLLRAIAGLLRPTAGTVTLSDMPGDDTARGVSMVFQSFALFPWLTVMQNVERRASRPMRGASGPSPPSILSASTASRTPIRRSSPAACANGWAWPAPWLSSRRCC